MADDKNSRVNGGVHSPKEWLEQCRAVYERMLPKLQEQYAGKFVAITPNGVLDNNSDPMALFEKYVDKKRSRVELFHVPDPGDEKETELRIHEGRVRF